MSEASHPEPRPSSLIVSASGIRGIVGRGLDAEVAARYGAAYGSWLRAAGGDAGGADRRPRVLLGRDSRVSGPVLADAVAAGLGGAGCDVHDLGIVPTPTALLAVQDDPEADGGVIVTASHNPAEWNGLKLSGPGGEFVSPEEGRAVQQRFESGPTWADWDGVGRRDTSAGALDHHVERIVALPLLEPERIAEADLTVAVDAVRGAAGPLVRALLQRLGCTVSGLDLEPDGRFPRDPEPRPENLAGLGARVRDVGADLGMAIDPDGDRLALVDEEGEPIGEDLTLALAAEYVLARRAGPVVTNLSSSRVIADVAERAGVPFHLAPVGEANVARRMREVDAVVGGEGNGGVMVPDLHLTRDAPLAAALVLGLLAGREATLGECAAALPVYHIAKRRVERPGGDLDPIYRELAGAADGAQEDRQDGLRLDWPEARKWVHVRPSGTEPILRVIAEAPEPDEAEALAEWALDTVARAAAPSH